jgi:hypothetical protein
LVRLAIAELYGPLWSARILEEMRRNVVENAGVDEAYAARTVELLGETFEEAEVDAEKIAALEPAMTNQADDRHVLAAAVAADCELIVTFNLDDFPAAACEPLLVEVVHPDRFLLDLYDLSPDIVYRTIAEQATALRRSTFDGLLEMLERAGVPQFAEAIRQHRKR